MLLLAVALVPAASISAAEWIVRAPMPYPAGQAAVVSGPEGKIHLFGGWPDRRRTQIYDPSANTWTLGPDTPKFSVGDCGIVAPDGRIHLFSKMFPKGLLVFEPRTLTWLPSQAADWVTTAAAAVQTSDGRCFIFGGERPDALTSEYFPASFTVEARAEIPYCPDEFSKSVRFPGAYRVTDDDLYVIGGLPNFDYLFGPLDDVAVYHPSADEWTVGLSPMPTARFAFGHVRGWNGFLYAIGGSNVYTMREPPYLSAVEFYDPQLDRWRSGPPLPEGRRECMAAIDSEGVIYLMGGSGPPSGDYSTTVFALDTRVGIGGPAPADLDRDGDVDRQDLEIFAACATGPAVPYDPDTLPAGCAPAPSGEGLIPADFDRDRDLDLNDFAVIQRCYSGEDLPAGPGC